VTGPAALVGKQAGKSEKKTRVEKNGRREDFGNDAVRKCEGFKKPGGGGKGTGSTSTGAKGQKEKKKWGECWVLFRGQMGQRFLWGCFAGIPGEPNKGVQRTDALAQESQRWVVQGDALEPTKTTAKQWVPAGLHY